MAPAISSASPRPVLAVPLARHVDQAAAVGEEVGHVEDAALVQNARDRAARERVVGGARPPRGSRARGRARSSIMPPAAQGASTSSGAAMTSSADGGELRRRARRGSARRAAGRGRRRGSRAPCALRRRGEHGAHLAEADHADAAAVELGRAGGGREPAPQRLEDGLRGDGGGVAAAAVLDRAPDHEAREARHEVHVGAGRADVLGRHVGALQPVDHVRGALEPRLAQLVVAVVDHDRLAAAQVEARPPTPSASSCATGHITSASASLSPPA